MKIRRILPACLCFLLILLPSACLPDRAAEPALSPTPGSTARPPRPTRTKPGGPAPVHASPTPRAQPTHSAPATALPTTDPASTLFEMNYQVEGTLFADPFITRYGQALVVPLLVNGANTLRIVNFKDGTQASYAYPLEFLVPEYAFSLAAGGCLLADSSGEALDLWQLTGNAPAQKLASIPFSGMNITSLAFSPDGKTLALGMNVGEVRLYRTSDGALQRTLKAHNDFVLSVIWSWDGRTLLTDSTSFDPHTYAWNPATGAKLATLSSESWNPAPPAIASDGSLAAGVSDDGTRIFSTSNWRQEGATFTALWDGKFTCDSQAFMLDTRSQTEIYSLESGALLETLDVGLLYCLWDGRTAVLENYMESPLLTVRIVRP